MSKYRMYIDLWPGIDPAQFAVMATTRPTAKIKGTRRLAFDVTIPDEMMFEVDGDAAHVTRPKLVEEETPL